MDDLKEAALLKAADSNIHLVLAMAHTWMGSLEAFACVDRALELNPGDVQALILRSKLRWARGQLEPGIRDFRAAMALKSDHPEVLVFQQLMAQKAKKLCDAAKVHTCIDLIAVHDGYSSRSPHAPDPVRICPDSSLRSSFITPQAAIEGRDLSKAISILNLAIKVTPEDMRLVVLRASTLRRAGHFDDAMKDLDKCSLAFFRARYGLEVRLD